jgi:glycosyltransferase involved in cell wall biosynthesis
LHVIGGGQPEIVESLVQLAADLSISEHVTFHGRVSQDAWSNWLVGVDAGVQLRTSALLSLSGALAECMSAGLPCVATAALVREMGAPSYVFPVAERAGPFLIAEALEQLLNEARGRYFSLDRERYLRSRSAAGYASAVVTALDLHV